MSSHNDNFIDSENTIHMNNDLDKIANLKATFAANNHVFVFIYMDGCGHCVAAEAAWIEFFKEGQQPLNAAAFAVSNAMMEQLEPHWVITQLHFLRSDIFITTRQSIQW